MANTQSMVFLGYFFKKKIFVHLILYSWYIQYCLILQTTYQEFYIVGGAI